MLAVITKEKLFIQTSKALGLNGYKLDSLGGKRRGARPLVTGDFQQPQRTDPGTAAPPGEHDQGPPEGNRFHFKLLQMITNRPGQLSRANEAKVIVPTPVCSSQKQTQLSTHRPTLRSGCKLVPSPDTAGP